MTTLKRYITPEDLPETFAKKPEDTRVLINEALQILEDLGVPTDKLPARQKERAAMALLAVCDVDKPGKWADLKDISTGRSMRTRDIIAWQNERLSEHRSPGAYDDIRRKDLKLSVIAEVIVNTKPGSARNDSTRGYALNTEHAALIRTFGKLGWEGRVKKFRETHRDLSEEMARKRDLDLVEVVLPDGVKLALTPGVHNLLQKAVVEDFLPRFARGEGSGFEVLYIGDAANKVLYKATERLKELKVFELKHGELPDVIAYVPEKNWLYLVEAVHSFGPIDEARRMKLAKLLEECPVKGIVFVTAFMDKTTFKKHAHEIAWETEVWVAEDPDHMIHFNGEKFLGPYQVRILRK